MTDTAAGKESDIAITTVHPLPTAVTSPVESTVAINVSPLDQVAPATGPAMACPFRSVKWGMSRTRSPIPLNASADRSVRRPAATCITVTRASADADPDAARTVVVPGPVAVTTPPSTPATDSFALDQETAQPMSSCPASPRTSAESRTVSSIAARVTSAGVIEIVKDGVAGGGAGGREGSGDVVESPQESTRRITVPADRAHRPGLGAVLPARR